MQAGRGCTLLIHEATFEPCLEQQARQKRHSTTAEALEVAQVRAASCRYGAPLLPGLALPPAFQRPAALAPTTPHVWPYVGCLP